MKKGMLAVLVLAVLLLAPAGFAFAQAPDPTVTLTIIAPDNTALANAPVHLYDSAGKQYNATTDASGVASVTVSATGLHDVLAVGSGYYILTVINVTGDVSATVNATAMKKVAVSAPVAVEFKVARDELASVKIPLKANATVYTDTGTVVVLEFPATVWSFPYAWKLERVKYDTSETTNSTVEIAVAADTTVEAQYSKVLVFQVLPTWALIAMISVIAVACVIVAAAPKAAKHAIEAYRDAARRFVKHRHTIDYSGQSSQTQFVKRKSFVRRADEEDW
jgi:hypothetical protein